MKMILPGVLLAAMMGYMIWSIATLPFVYMTYPAQECVKVDSWIAADRYGYKYSCENLPTKYEIIWVDGDKL